jgi:hypothetical protein
MREVGPECEPSIRFAINCSALEKGQVMNSRRWIKPIVAVLVALVVTGIAGAAWQNTRDREVIGRARNSVDSGRYADARAELARVRLPLSSGASASVRQAMADSISADDAAWKALEVSARAMAGAAGDRNGDGEVPAGVADDFTHDLRGILARPAVSAMTADALSKRLSTLGLPKIAVVIITDVRSSAHVVRLARFVVSNKMDYFSGPREDRNQSDCFNTGMTCWSFNAFYSRLLASVPRAEDVPSGVYEITTKDEGANPGTFQGARLLDWHNGLAVTIAGSYAASNGGNNGETWWHIWRLDRNGRTQIDGAMLPFQSGVDALDRDRATGLVGKDSGNELTPFNECHACAHVAREFVAMWSADDGRYRVLSTRIRPSPYATLVRYVQSDKGDNFLDPTANISRVRAMRDFVNRMRMSGNQCNILSAPADADTKAVVSEIRMSCGYYTIGIKTVRHGGEWSLSDAYNVAAF